jgi:hypothetical protein
MAGRYVSGQFLCEFRILASWAAVYGGVSEVLRYTRACARQSFPPSCPGSCRDLQVDAKRAVPRGEDGLYTNEDIPESPKPRSGASHGKPSTAGPASPVHSSSHTGTKPSTTSNTIHGTASALSHRKIFAGGLHYGTDEGESHWGYRESPRPVSGRASVCLQIVYVSILDSTVGSQRRRSCTIGRPANPGGLGS